MSPTRAVKLRILAVLALGLAPAGFLVGVGFYHLWDTGWAFYAYWPMFACWLASYLLGRYWTRRAKVTAPTAAAPPGYWTERDKLAWEIVEAHAVAAQAVAADDFADLKRYAAEAQDLALKVARVYRPAAADPFGHFTLPELLACSELVSHDLTKMVNGYIPGSHLMSVNDLKRVRTAVDRAVEWYPKLRNVYWLASAVFNPVKTGLQVLATKGGLAPAFAGFQQNMMLWFHTAYVREMGRYLIELNSGRLKVGAKRYLELMEQHVAPPAADVTADGGRPSPGEADAPAAPPGGTDGPRPPAAATVTLVGPVKAGKSSLVNALLGEQRAGTDVLPLTAGATRYVLRQLGQPALTVIDTAGFGQDGASEADVLAAVTAAAASDMVVLVVPARSAARKPESDFLDRVRTGLAASPNLRMPPVLLALSQVDKLTPAAEWAPPYDWRAGQRPKETQMREAALAAGEVFGGRVLAVIPVCGAAGKELGVRDELLPAIAGLLGEARGVALLRALHAEASADKAKRVVNQLLNAGGQVLKAWWESGKK